ncbi:MAG: phosphopantetheine-binding protein [Oscillatoria sp. PMC 1068.18]|nr:phosphopantetheine-binding protein [Oscillatoria sp. PMC 1076.18]MEC4987616.1 phosphopantetheine-binding protein [Oscillatoria sp. PMC 1068.18]
MKTQIQLDINNLLEEMTRMQTQIAIASILHKLLQQRHLDIEEVSPHLRLRADLGFESLDIVNLVVAIEEKFQQKLCFAQLLMKDGQYVDDLNVEQLVTFVVSKLHHSN